MNLPNALTLVRIFAVPVLVALLMTKYMLVAAVIFLAASLTLGTGIVVTGVLAFAAAGQLAYWIPRAEARRKRG